MTTLRTWYHHRPIRTRLTIGFVAAMAVALLAAGGFVYERVSFALNRALSEDLTRQLSDLTSPAGRVAQSASSTIDGRRGTYEQIESASGTVVASTQPVHSAPLLSARQLRSRDDGVTTVDRDQFPGIPYTLRIMARKIPATSSSPVRYAVAAVPRNHHDEALHELIVQLIVADLSLLLVSAAIGHYFARRALGPVDVLQQQAASIVDATSTRTLTVPEADDELRRLAVTLNEMLTSIQTSVDRERRFIGDASHELRTPLGLIKTSVELALRRPHTTDELRGVLDSIGEDTERLIRLTEALLTIARIEQRGFETTRPVQLGATIDEAVEHIRHRHPEAADTLRVTVDGDLATTGDTALIQLAIVNLLDNAIRHGGGRVTLTAMRVQEEIVVQVADDGAGFSPDFIDRALAPFVRAHGTTASGSGLGLAIVDRIARAHNGRVTIDQTRSSGAAVDLHLPAGGIQSPATAST